MFLFVLYTLLVYLSVGLRYLCCAFNLYLVLVWVCTRDCGCRVCFGLFYSCGVGLLVTFDCVFDLLGLLCLIAWLGL